ncbi:YaaC family protein [Longibaculum muris]|uniref:YaaC family protein n=1 Tax=Longibaculum muris TaxID=1796628 RepID=UPI003AB3C1A6
MNTIFSENPENDLWRELLQFTYEANIKRYLLKKGHEADDNTINCIAGSFLQANEYYRAAKDANLQISPLLLYYGSTNLLYGMANLLSGSINKISNHGMKIFVPEQMDFIANTEIRFLSPVDGGIHVVARALGFTPDLTGFGDWSLGEFLDSIAEINDDFAQCYDVKTGCIAMLDIFNTPDGKTEKIYYLKENKDNLMDLLKKVEGFEKSYLKVTAAKEFLTGKEYFVLRHKLTGKDISEQSYSGQPYLRAGHIKNSQLITIPAILNMYISLFALASLCRYYPERWSPFVLKDTTGEKLLIEKFMYYARRLIPNYALNNLLERPVQYSSNRYTVTDTTKLVGEHQVQEMVERKVKSELDRQHITIRDKR